MPSTCLRLAAVLCALLPPGCFSPDLGARPFACKASPACPEGYRCVDGVCVTSSPADGPLRDSTRRDLPPGDAVGDRRLSDGPPTDGPASDSPGPDGPAPDGPAPDGPAPDAQPTDQGAADQLPPDQPSTVAWWDSGWKRRRKLTFNNGSIGKHLDDFPVLVVLNSSRINYGKTRPAGQDLRFIDDDDKSTLAFEIESWNTSGDSYVWVKVPRIDASSTTDHIWLYHDNPSAADGQSPTAVWSAGYDAVYHLDGGADATGNHAPATGGGTATGGQIATGRDFSAGGSYLDTGFSANYGSGKDFTWEGWFRSSSISGSGDLLGIEDRGAGDKSEIRFAIRDQDGDKKAERFDVWIRPDSGTAFSATTVATVGNGGWHHAALLRQGGTGRLYLDGQQVSSGPVGTGPLTFPVTLLIGAQWQTDSSGVRNTQIGDLDEIRTSGVARSPAWISAQHKSMTDSYVVFGNEQSAP